MFYEQRDSVVIYNNINDNMSYIRGGGKLSFTKNGVFLEGVYNTKFDKLISLEELINLYGTQKLQDLYNYASAKTTNPVDQMVKNRIMELLTRGEIK